METLYKKMKRNNKYALTTTLNPTLIRYIQRVTLAFPDQHSQLFVATAIQTLVAAEHINIPKKLFQYISMYLECLVLKFFNLFLNQNIQVFSPLIFRELTQNYIKHINMMLKSHQI